MLKKLLATALAVTVISPMSAMAGGHLDKITIIQPSYPSMIFWPSHISAQLGFYEEMGVDPTYLDGDTTVPYQAFLLNGQADFAMLDGPQVFQGASAEMGLKTVYSVHSSAPEGVYVSADSPLQSVTELKGKTVGLASDRDLASLKVAMAHADSNIDGVSTVVVGDAGPTLANVFLKGTAAAFAGSISDLAALATKGVVVRDITPPSAKVAPANTYAVNGATMMDNYDKYCRFLKAYSMGVHVGQYNLDIIAAMSKAKDGAPHQWEVEEVGNSYLQAVAKLQLPPEGDTSYGLVAESAWLTVNNDMKMIGAVDADYNTNDYLSHVFEGCANNFDRAAVEAAADAWMAKNG